MPIEVACVEKQPQINQYPTIKKHVDGYVVLFTELNTGVCLVTVDDKHLVGKEHADWDESSFDFVDSVTVTNKWTAPEVAPIIGTATAIKIG